MAARKFNTIGDLSESWVELNSGGILGAEGEYLRLLREAQRESRESSAKSSPKSPPNSPNLEPSTEDELKGVYINCWKDDSNDWVWQWSSRPDQLPPKWDDDRNDDFLVGGSGRGRARAGDELPLSLDWRFRHPQSSKGPPSATSSIEVLEQQLIAPTMQQSHCLSVRRSCLFSRGALAAVLVTNLMSLLLGAGIGVWLSRKGMLPPRLIVLN